LVKGWRKGAKDRTDHHQSNTNEKESYLAETIGEVTDGKIHEKTAETEDSNEKANLRVRDLEVVPDKRKERTDKSTHAECEKKSRWVNAEGYGIKFCEHIASGRTITSV